MINSTGQINSVRNLEDGQYPIIYFSNRDDANKEVDDANLQVSNMTTSDTTLWNTIFSIQSTTKSKNIYLVEQLTIEQDNTVVIVASEFPCDNDNRSKMALDITNDSNFTFDT